VKSTRWENNQAYGISRWHGKRWIVEWIHCNNRLAVVDANALRVLYYDAPSSDVVAALIAAIGNDTTPEAIVVPLLVTAELAG
jgi:hypothetical protein